jgi:D-alanyl-D-alanine dipeptidase
MSYDPSEPVSEVCRVPIRENGEPMVDVLTLSERIFLDRPRFDYKRESLLRIGVAERLAQAAERLPAGYSFGLVEGWRPPFIQTRMFRSTWRHMAERYPDLSDEQLRPIVETFTAPMDDKVPPPHTTGGAFDLALYVDGEPVDMNSPYEWRDPEGFAFSASGLSDAALFHRSVLAGAFEGTGITNYPSEYWHWSYGDQGWAYRGDHAAALYGAIEPPNWKPEPRDAIDAPLELLPDIA